MSGVYSALGPDGFGTYFVDWDSGSPSFERVSKPPRGLLVPGFVDIHIHGAFGIDFMSASEEHMRLLCDKLSEEGYEAFLPTTVTAPAAAVREALSSLPEHPMILGFHLEGPFISPRFPGAQPPDAIEPAPMAGSEWDPILDDPRLRVVTLAPEMPNALDLIARLMRRGVIVSMGHSDATYDEARRGMEFGARHATHAFNAMRGFHHREPGLAGYVLLSAGLRAELIYDRLHVAGSSAELLLRCKAADEVIAVSDSTMATGMPPNLEIEMWGHACVTGRGGVRLVENDALAGSAITLREAFANLAEDFGAETAIRACCLNPRRALGLTEPRTWIVLDQEYRVAERRESAQPAG